MSDIRITDAVDALGQGDCDAAIELLSGYELAGDDELQRRFHLASAFHRKKMVEEAYGMYKWARQLAPNHIPTIANLAMIADERNDLVTAQGYYHELFALDPENPDFPYRYGCMFQRNAQYVTQLPLPISCFTRALDLDPLHHGALEMRAYCHFQAHDYAAAEEDIFHLLYAAPGWRDRIQPAMRDAMQEIWGPDRLAVILEEADAAPVPYVTLIPELAAMQRHLDATREQFARNTFGLNASLIKEHDERRAYLLVAEQERGDGLAGCTIEQYTLGKWVGSVPLPLMQWFVLFMRLVDRPLPNDDSPTLKDDIRQFHRKRGLDLDELAGEVDININEKAFDIDGVVWPKELRLFLRDHGRRLFSAIIDPESSDQERSQAILEVAKNLPNTLPDTAKREKRLAAATTYANLFVLLHEATHVFSKHRELEAGYACIPEGPQVWRWQAEVHADRQATISLLRLAYDPDEPFNDSMLALFYALAMVMTTIGIQQRMDPEAVEKLHYPPPALRMLGIDATVCEKDEVRTPWEVMLMHFIGSAFAVGEACNWPELVATVRELFLDGPSQGDVDKLAAHQIEFIQQSVAIGGRPLILGS